MMTSVPSLHPTAMCNPSGENPAPTHGCMTLHFAFNNLDFAFQMYNRPASDAVAKTDFSFGCTASPRTSPL